MDDGRVPDTNIQEVRSFLSLEHFKVDVIDRRNSAAAALCSWVLNIVEYYDILQEVKPKRRAEKEATARLEAANCELAEVRRILLCGECRPRRLAGTD